MHQILELRLRQRVSHHFRLCVPLPAALQRKSAGPEVREERDFHNKREKNRGREREREERGVEQRVWTDSCSSVFTSHLAPPTHLPLAPPTHLPLAPPTHLPPSPPTPPCPHTHRINFIFTQNQLNQSQHRPGLHGDGSRGSWETQSHFGFGRSEEENHTQAGYRARAEQHLQRFDLLLLVQSLVQSQVLNLVTALLWSLVRGSSCGSSCGSSWFLCGPCAGPRGGPRSVLSLQEPWYSRTSCSSRCLLLRRISRSGAESRPQTGSGSAQTPDETRPSPGSAAPPPASAARQRARPPDRVSVEGTDLLKPSPDPPKPPQTSSDWSRPSSDPPGPPQTG
ncbi:hypothetical protein WMY93_031647 [Mugilogobius chulae]|uniref:Uncharacterized protein n=1 Tax=Mugilogobius chulae TaxID=88201 RepID=A0AAW0ME63_9GOBI